MKSTCIIWDWNRTLFDPETQQLYPDALTVLIAFRKVGATQVLVSQFEASGAQDVTRLVPGGIFADLAVIPKKNFWAFLSLAWRFRRFQRFVIGDRARGEIILGNLTGCKTIWVRRGKFQDQMPRHFLERPHLMVSTLSSIIPLFPTAGFICAEEPEVGNNPQENPDEPAPPSSRSPS